MGDHQRRQGDGHGPDHRFAHARKKADLIIERKAGTSECEGASPGKDFASGKKNCQTLKAYRKKAKGHQPAENRASQANQSVHLNFRCEENNMKARVAALLVAVMLAGCTAPQAPPLSVQEPTAPTPTPTLSTFEISVPFDKEQASRLVRKGPNTVKGNAVMYQQGAGTVTCAGQTVYLIPATAYATQRMLALYRNTKRGVIAARIYYRFIPDPPEYRALTRSSRCDPQGNFVFDRVSDGEFFIVALVSWQVGDSSQGSQLMYHVSVRAGQTLSVAMVP
jgi:hypothetical protein